MSDPRTNLYAERLAVLIRIPTVSEQNQADLRVFYRFHDALREMFPHLFAVCTFEDFDGSILLCWKGKSEAKPILLMNHMDVVEAPGTWTHPPFAGEIADGKLWGRGTLDTKSGLWAMLQAAEELAAEGFVPKRDIYFMSTRNEESGGAGADCISRTLLERGIHFDMVLDEGGMIVQEPISAAKGSFAMIGLGEKGYADLKFVARSTGGHASTPGKNTPLVRLGKFMAAVEKSNLFKAEISPTIHAMFSCLSSSMKGALRFVLAHSKLFAPLLVKLIPALSDTAGAMLKTTLAFTMAQASEASNVLPQEAWVIGNMRYSHHQGCEESIAAVTKLAKKFDVETLVLAPGVPSPLTDHNSAAYRLVEKAVSTVFIDVTPSPYLMTGASDSRYMSRVCDCCLRFAPFRISAQQLASVHALDENLDLSTLAPAVDFYRYIITEA